MRIAKVGVTPEVLRTIERHTREYPPFEVYAKSLYDLFRGQEETAGEWELGKSKVYEVLSKYQQDGYHGLLKRAGKHGGALLCDGVGLGKTFVGLMLIERLVIHEGKPVALFVPKAAREAVWEATIQRYLPELLDGFYPFKIANHTDLLRKGMRNELEQIRAQAKVIVIDEAHHFRNIGLKGENEGERKSRYWAMFDVAEGKQVYMLTATPINNRLTDFQHMVELFSRRKPDYFADAPLGIHSLAGHIRKIEKSLDRAALGQAPEDAGIQVDLFQAEQLLGHDELFNALVVQRSRAYVKKSMAQEGDGQVLFPKPRDPKVVPYSVKQTYGKLLKAVEEAFSKEKALFSLAIYYPLAYYKGPDSTVDPLVENRQRQVVGLIRVQFLKRFESSVEAFTMSCWNLLRKLLAWVEVHAETNHEKQLLERWKRQHAALINYVHAHQHDLFDEEPPEESEEDVVPPEMLEAVDRLSRDEYKVDEIISETILDLDQIADFLKELQDFKPSQDKKLRALVNLLKSDAVLREHKVIVFSEFKDTARYLKKQLEAEGFDGVEEIDSATKGDRAAVIRRFSPYYNDSSSGKLAENGEKEIRLLISTDVLSEGLNLQDATRLINYDLHWNPVRLMQRIGRVDRRMNPAIEAQIVADHPDQEKIRGEVAYWNFLPPEELDELLRLYSKVAHKTLRISKTFGIEGRKLLTPEDDFDDLRDFTEAYEGHTTPLEEMKLELNALLKNDPALKDRLEELPGRVFSGKEHPQAGTRAVFFCYARPGHDETPAGGQAAEDKWSLDAGDVQWYLYDTESKTILEDPARIVAFIRCAPDTPRQTRIETKTLGEIRKEVEKHIKDTYLKKVQAPGGIKAVLTAWMELN